MLRGCLADLDTFRRAHAYAAMGKILQARATSPQKAGQDAEPAEGLPEEALQPLLYALSNDGSVRVRRGAMAVLKQATLTRSNQLHPTKPTPNKI